MLKGTARKISSQKGRFLNFLRPLITAGSSLMKNVLTPFAKIFLLPIGMSTADAAIRKKIHGSGTTALHEIISNEEMEDIIKIVKLLEESG